MRVVHDPQELRSFPGGAFVPTMGALHEGHASLIRRAKASGLPVCLSIFVNPTQFGPKEDLSRYPRTLDADLAIAERDGADVAFVPSVDVMYPEGIEEANRVASTLPLPDVATKPGLEDRCRPGHFAGVQLVVARLFDMARPAVAVFGEKDWQQLKLIEAMVARAKVAEPARWPELRILPHATVRERDGLAMSSRNRYLTPELREQSLGIARALQVAHSAQRPATAEKLMRETLELHGFSLDYAVVRDADTLLPVGDFARPTRALIAARIGPADAPVRLIDNAAMTVWS
ncbi:MAG: pantoate--beta-alanine ligase [Phycisphaerae bacterium]|nr:pantoate--beta-alanine ligase [Phycisphaerae bacterium]